MAYTKTSWKFTNIETENADRKYPEAGPHHLQITEASYTEDPKDLLSAEYVLKVKDLDDEELYYPSLKYKLYNVNSKTGSLFLGTYTKRTLVSLGKAIWGPNWKDNDYPFPDDLVGKVVLAKVERNPSKNDPSKVYTNINEFFAPLSEYAALAPAPQYYEGASPEEIQELDASREEQ